MKKNLLAVSLSLLFTISPAAPILAANDVLVLLDNSDDISADTTENGEVSIEMPVNQREYFNFIGTIEEVNKENDTISLLVKNADDEIYFHIYSTTVLLNNEGNEISSDAFKKGQDVLMAYSAKAPVAISLPPQINPSFAVLLPAVGSVKVDTFNDDYLSSDGELKLNVSDETPIYTVNGDVMHKTDIIDKTLAVFYTIATFSIPPQTPPDKIIIMDSEAKQSAEETLQESDTFYGEDFYIRDNIKMIPLAKTGAFYGYEVEWEGKTKTVTLAKGNSSYTITIGETMYGYNRSVRYFQNAPEIKDSRTYVPEEFLDMLN